MGAAAATASSPGLQLFSSSSLSFAGIPGGLPEGERQPRLLLVVPLACWRTEPMNRTPPRALLLTCDSEVDEQSGLAGSWGVFLKT